MKNLFSLVALAGMFTLMSFSLNKTGEKVRADDCESIANSAADALEACSGASWDESFDFYCLVYDRCMG